MIINDKKNVTTTLSGGTSFGVERSSKIFKVLSKNIYKNPIMAFIRELTTNAADAHIDAKNDTTPIDIKIPSRLDHTFYVRDYGTGLSHEDLLSIYKIYFKSTKDQDNDSDGLYGLGSKSPLAYSNDFMVEDFFNGKKFSYIAMFDQNGEPQFVPLTEEDTTEPNGIKVTITIKQEDFKRVYDDVARVMMFVKQPINIIGDQAVSDRVDLLRSLVYGKGQYAVYSDDDVLILKPDQVSGLSNIAKYNVIQGNVCYPIDLATLKTVTDVETINGQSAGNHIYFFKFDRGEIGVPPSREEITYDRTYVDRIVVKSTKIVEKLSKNISKLFDEVKSVSDYTDLVRYYKNTSAGEIAALNGLVYDRSKVDSSSVLKKRYSLQHPIIKGKNVVFGPVLTDINSNAFFDQVVSKINDHNVSIGTIIMSKDIRQTLLKHNVKVDEYKANQKMFERELRVSPSGDIYEMPSEFDKKIREANKDLRYYDYENKCSLGYRSTARYFVEQDDVKPCSMIHFTRLTAGAALDDSVFFYEPGKLNVEKYKNVSDVFNQIVNGLNTSANHIRYSAILKIHKYTSSKAIAAFIGGDCF